MSKFFFKFFDIGNNKYRNLCKCAIISSLDSYMNSQNKFYWWSLASHSWFLSAYDTFCHAYQPLVSWSFAFYFSGEAHKAQEEAQEKTLQWPRAMYDEGCLFQEYEMAGSNKSRQETDSLGYCWITRRSSQIVWQVTKLMYQIRRKLFLMIQLHSSTCSHVCAL